jgi:GPI-anchor transamidase subunit U
MLFILGVPGQAIVELAMASYLSLYPILLLPPLIILCQKSSPKVFTCPAIAHLDIGAEIVPFVRCCIWRVISGVLCPHGLLGLSCINIRSHVPLISLNVLIASLFLSDLTPTVGLWWYFFIEMFDSFRSFFLVVFQLHLLIYIAPLCIRLHRQPLHLIAILIGIISIFKSYPSVSDLSLFLGLLSISGEEIFSRSQPFCVQN